MGEKKQYVKANWYFILVSIIIIFPILYYASMSMPVMDDFWNCSVMKAYWERTPNSFFATWARCYEFYFSTGGYYFALFLNSFFVPFARWGCQGLRAFNVVAHIFFFSSLYLFISIFAKHVMGVDGKVKWFLFCGFIFSLVNNYHNSEVYTWYCVLAAYVLPMSFMFIELSFFIVGCYTRNKLCSFSAVIIAFVVSGSSLNATALHCELVFLFSLYGYFVLGRKKESIAIFIFALSGALLNAFAPGNFVRHSAVGENYPILWSVANSFLSVGKLFWNRIVYTWFVPVIIVVFLVTYKYFDPTRLKITFQYPLWFLGLFFGAVAMVDFPVVLGYLSKNLSDRCIWVHDIATYLLGYLMIVYLVGWIKSKGFDYTISTDTIKKVYKEHVLSSAKLYFLVHGCLVYFILVYLLFPFPTLKMISSIMDKSLRDHIRYEENILYELERSEDDIVIIERPYPKRNPYMPPLIEKDSDELANKVLSAYYGKCKVYIR